MTWVMVGNMEMEAWYFWNWNVKERSAFGDEDGESRQKHSFHSSLFLHNNDSDSNLLNKPCYWDM